MASGNNTIDNTEACIDEWLEGFNSMLPKGRQEMQYTINKIASDITMDYTKCEHEYINVGFSFDKYVCKKCNCEKK